MGEKEIIQEDLAEISVSDNGTVYRGKSPTIFESMRGPFRDIAIAWHQKFSLMGSYRMDVHFTHSDVLRLFKAMFGTELRPWLLENQGFTVSPELAKMILQKVKLTDLTLGELMSMNSSGATETSAANEQSSEVAAKKILLRRV